VDLDTTTGNDTVHSFVVVPGDTVALQVGRSNTTPTVRLNITARCQ